MYQHLSGYGRHQPDHVLEHRALAAPGSAQDYENLPFADVKGQIRHNGLTVIPGIQVFHLYNRFFHTSNT
jgi:hypothetical protein